MSVTIKILGIGPALIPCEHSSRFVSIYDPDAAGGTGLIESTDDPAEALRFENKADAIMFSRQASTVRPTRLDGKPNRPLTAYTVIIEETP
jgi:hypothetical protein